MFDLSTLFQFRNAGNAYKPDSSSDRGGSSVTQEVKTSAEKDPMRSPKENPENG